MNALDEKEKIIARLQFELDEARAKIIELESWKGKDIPIIFKNNDHWVVKIHRKNRETGVVKTEVHRVTNESVDILYHTIIKLSKGTNRYLEPMEIWEELMRVYNISFELDAFNGGKKRSPYYFPFYYYGMKILQHQELIEYKSGGGKSRLLDPHRKILSQKINLVSAIFD